MSKVIDNVAEAICNAHGESWLHVREEAERGISTRYPDHFRALARAAILAMREITPEMRNAFREGAPHYISYVIVDEGWGRAIDAALTNQQPAGR